MLSNEGIKKYIASGDIVVKPFDESKLGASKIKIHLGSRILIPDGKVVVDVKNETVPTYQEVIMADDAPFTLAPGAFVLGETHEAIGLSEKIGMLIEGKSTLARLGVSIVQTAMLIDTGQQPKKMTLEIYNAGPNPVLLYPHMKCGHVIVFLLDPPATLRYDEYGKYLVGDANKPIFKKEF